MKHIDDAARLAAVVFAMKRWEWCLSPSGALTPAGQASMRIPNEAEIADTLREFLAEMSRSGSISYDSGRLHVEWNEDFGQYEITMEIGRINPRELWAEEGIDRFVQLEED